MRRTALILPTVAVAGLALLAGCSSSSGGDSCLNGSWALADTSVLGLDQATIDQLQSMGGSFDFTLKFSGSTISLDASVSVPATAASEAQDSKGTGQGKFSVSGGKITVKDWTESSTINGVEQTGDDFNVGLGNTTKSDYTCSGDKLTLDGIELTRK